MKQSMRSVVIGLVICLSATAFAEERVNGRFGYNHQEGPTYSGIYFDLLNSDGSESSDPVLQVSGDQPTARAFCKTQEMGLAEFSTDSSGINLQMVTLNGSGFPHAIVDSNVVLESVTCRQGR